MLATALAAVAVAISPCQTTLDPGANIAAAISAANAGDTICLSSGSYGRVSTIAAKDSVTVRPVDGEKASVAGAILTRASGITFKGLDITSEGVMIRGSSDIKLVGNHIHDIRRASSCPTAPNVGNGYAVWLVGYNSSRSQRITIAGNTIERVTHDAIQIGSTDDLLIEGNEITDVRSQGCGDHSDAIQWIEGRGVTIRGNHVHHNVHGFMVNGHGTTVRAAGRFENNLVHDISGGIAFNLYNVDGLAVVSNTVWATGTTAVRLRDTDTNPTVMRATVRNNIFEEYDSQCDSTGCVTAQDHNLFASSSDRVASDLAASNPRFAPDYELSSDSAAIDAGATTDAPTLDRRGRPRVGPPDLGAHEFQGGSGSDPSAPPDEDRDGVDDSSDVCDATPGPAPTGCPLPVASFTISPNPSLAGQEVVFDGSASACHPGPCRYAWRETPSWPFGTGQPVERFTFRSVKEHPIELTVTDGLNRSASRSHVLTVR